MRKKHIKWVLAVLMMGWLTLQPVSGQLTSPGDAMIVGYAQTNLAFVVFKPVPGGSQVSFHPGFDIITVTYNSFFQLHWTAPTGGIPAGTVVDLRFGQAGFSVIASTGSAVKSVGILPPTTGTVCVLHSDYTNIYHMLFLDGSSGHINVAALNLSMGTTATAINPGTPSRSAVYSGPRNTEELFDAYLPFMGQDFFWESEPSSSLINLIADPTFFALSFSPDVPEAIRYQGRLVDGTNLLSGVVDVGVCLFDQPSGGTLYYSETQTVLVADGLYDMTIGESNEVVGALGNVFSNRSVYLELDINGQILTPREKIESVAYALRAARVPSGSIKTETMAFGAVTGEKIAGGVVTDFHMADDAVTGAKILNGTIAGIDLAANSVTGDKIVNGTISNVDLAISSVISATVLDGSLTGADIANGAVSNINLAVSSVTSATVLDSSLTGTDIANGTISNIDLAVSSVTSATILDGTISTIDIEDGAVTLPKINTSANLITRSEGDGRYINVTNDNLSTTVNGTPSAPAHSFLSDADTGMYRDSENILGFSTAGSERMRISSNGLVGVGAPSPAAELHVRKQSSGSSIALGPILALENNTNVFASFVGPNNATMGIFFQIPINAFPDAAIRFNGLGRREIIFRTMNSDRLMIASNGFVGINTTTPTNRLHVVGTVQATAYITSSDLNAKENIQPVSPEDVLAKVSALPISTWTFKDEPNGTHIGPMAQDFHATFGFGNTASGIMTVDADGVALAAIQALAKDKTEVREEVSGFSVRVSELEKDNKKLREELEEIKKKLGI